MQNWTDHGMILSWDSFTWGKEDTAWAAQCIERNGKFYYYVTLEHKNGGGRAIGVAVADSPTGPFKDALGKPLVGPNWDYIDPTVFIDDDGQAWLMFGNPSCYYVRLNEDMVSYSGSVGKFDMNAQTFGPSGKQLRLNCCVKNLRKKFWAAVRTSSADNSGYARNAYAALLAGSNP